MNNDVYDAAQVVADARRAGVESAGPVGHCATDATIGILVDRLIELFEGAIGCRGVGDQSDLKRGHDEALDWVCRELGALKEAL